MTREEFRIKFSQAVAEDDTELFEEIKPDFYLPYTVLSNRGLDTLTNIAEVAAEPLFEEIKTLRDLCQRTALENGRLRKENLIAIEEVEKSNEMIEEMEEEIKHLEVDISDLSNCEECGEEAKRLEANSCYPPHFCILCWNKMIGEIVKLKATIAHDENVRLEEGEW